MVTPSHNRHRTLTGCPSKEWQEEPVTTLYALHVLPLGALASTLLPHTDAVVALAYRHGHRDANRLYGWRDGQDVYAPTPRTYGLPISHILVCWKSLW